MESFGHFERLAGGYAVDVCICSGPPIQYQYASRATRHRKRQYANDMGGPYDRTYLLPIS